jgi:PAS domain S-box-containing protein
MNSAEMLENILESLGDPVVFVDTDHNIQYMNRKARTRYAKWGEVRGKSIFHCHNENSQKIIKECYEKLVSGEEEVLFASNKKHRVYMRSVRDSEGKLMGYYERYAAPVIE